MREALNADTEQPLYPIMTTWSMVKSRQATVNNMYCDTINMIQKNADGGVAQDTRQAAVTIKISLQAPDRLPASKGLMINNFDTRQLAIQNKGVMVKNYPQ